MISIRKFWWAALVASAIVGCSDDASKPEEHEADAAQDGDAGAVVLSDEEVAEIKKLPEAEAALALKQKVCPVSGEHLGAMDMPVKVRAEGKTFFLCCKGCNKELQADPKAVVAKLNE